MRSMRSARSRWLETVSCDLAGIDQLELHVRSAVSIDASSRIDRDPIVAIAGSCTARTVLDVHDATDQVESSSADRPNAAGAALK